MRRDPCSELAHPIHSGNCGTDVPEDFHYRGWTLRRGLHDLDAALAWAGSILSSLTPSSYGPLGAALPRLELAKCDRLPCREPDIQETFQALHFDMGLPLAERSEQSGYLFTMLYFPADGEPGRAQTRIVETDQLLRQRRFHSERVRDERLRDYADRFGDGWTEPEPYVTGRLGCFARVVDGMLESHELLSFHDKGTWEWFKDGPASPDGQREASAEIEWWRRHGFRIEEIEERLTLEPGNALLFDNVRCAHGRIGARRSEEIWQIMWGVPHLDASEVALIRRHLASALAKAAV